MLSHSSRSTFNSENVFRSILEQCTLYFTKGIVPIMITPDIHPQKDPVADSPAQHQPNGPQPDLPSVPQSDPTLADPHPEPETPEQFVDPSLEHQNQLPVSQSSKPFPEYSFNDREMTVINVLSNAVMGFHTRAFDSMGTYSQCFQRDLDCFIDDDDDKAEDAGSILLRFLDDRLNEILELAWVLWSYHNQQHSHREVNPNPFLAANNNSPFHDAIVECLALCINVLKGSNPPLPFGGGVDGSNRGTFQFNANTVTLDSVLHQLMKMFREYDIPYYLKEAAQIKDPFGGDGMIMIKMGLEIVTEAKKPEGMYQYLRMR